VLDRCVFSFTKLSAFLSVQGSFSVRIFKQDKAAPVKTGLRRKNTAAATLCGLLFTLVYDGSRECLNSLHSFYLRKKRFFGLVFAGAGKNSPFGESKHRLKASCFGKPKERAEARAHFTYRRQNMDLKEIYLGTGRIPIDERGFKMNTHIENGVTYCVISYFRKGEQIEYLLKHLMEDKLDSLVSDKKSDENQSPLDMDNDNG